MDRMHENVIEWRDGDKVAKCTFARGRYVTKVKRLIERGVPDVKIIHENADGSVFCQVPVRDVHISHFTGHGSFEPTASAPEGSDSSDSYSDDESIV